MLDADDGSQAFAGIVAGEVRVSLFQQPALAGVVVNHPRQACPQTCQMGPAIDGIDRIGERINGLGVCIRILHGELDADAFDLLFHEDHRV